MQTTIHRDTKLTDEELQRADEQARSWAKRVSDLMAASGCSAWMALKAIADADEETHE